MRQTKYAAGRQPYDALNGLRVGALAGALLGAAPALIWGTGLAWAIPVAAVLGGLAGYVSERRRMRSGDDGSS